MLDSKNLNFTGAEKSADALCEYNYKRMVTENAELKQAIKEQKMELENLQELTAKAKHILEIGKAKQRELQQYVDVLQRYRDALIRRINKSNIR